LFVLAPASRIRAISSLLYRFFFIDLSFPLERSYDFRWYDFRASGQSLVIRNQLISAPGLPTRPYIENIGVLPDIELDFMTRENLMTRGGPFVEEVTRIILSEIQKAAP